MIPLIIHHKVVDPFDTMLTACAEEWHQNMNARLVYDFILLFLLFIVPLTLMTYCYIRISFSLWFVDSYIRNPMSSSSSTTNTAQFSTMSEDSPRIDTNNARWQNSPINRPYYVHYHKSYDNDLKRKQQQNDSLNQDEYRLLINSSIKKSTLSQPVRSTTVNDIKPKSFSITTTNATAQTTCRRSSSLIGRHFGENAYTNQHLNQSQQGRQVSIRQRHSSSPHTSGIHRSSFTSLPSQNRILGPNIGRINGNNNSNNNTNNNNRRSNTDVERVSRFLKSRRRVVKLLITLGKIDVVLFLLKNIIIYLSNSLFLLFLL